MKKLIFIIGLLIVLVVSFPTSAFQDILKPYRIEGYNYLLFTRTDSLPFVELRPMCFDTNGWCDIEMVEGRDTYTWFRLTNYREEKAGVVNSVMYNNERYCYLFWWQDEYGEDGHPHPEYAVWVDCSVIDTYWQSVLN